MEYEHWLNAAVLSCTRNAMGCDAAKRSAPPQLTQQVVRRKVRGFREGIIWIQNARNWISNLKSQIPNLKSEISNLKFTPLGPEEMERHRMEAPRRTHSGVPPWQSQCVPHLAR